MPRGVYERKPYMKTFGKTAKFKSRLRWWRRRTKAKGVHPQTPGSGSYTALGEKFGISATHVMRLLKG